MKTTELHAGESLQYTARSRFVTKALLCPFNRKFQVEMKFTLIFWSVFLVSPLGLIAQEKVEDIIPLKENAKLSCQFTTPELRERKKTIIADLKNLVLEKTELANGFRYYFNGTDKTLDLLNNFIMTERLCCAFFTFTLTISDEKNFTTLELTGPPGVKDFIKEEIGF
jgi:hypothetical protein